VEKRDSYIACFVVQGCPLFRVIPYGCHVVCLSLPLKVSINSPPSDDGGTASDEASVVDVAGSDDGNDSPAVVLDPPVVPHIPCVILGTPVKYEQFVRHGTNYKYERLIVACLGSGQSFVNLHRAFLSVAILAQGHLCSRKVARYQKVVPLTPWPAAWVVCEDLPSQVLHCIASFGVQCRCPEHSKCFRRRNLSREHCKNLGAREPEAFLGAWLQA